MKKHYITPTFRLTAPDTCCVFCKNCLHYLWDYTNGIYSIICNAGADETKGWAGECDKFEWDGGKGEREPTEEEIIKHTQYMKEMIEFIETHFPLPDEKAGDKKVTGVVRISDIGKSYPIDP